MTRLRGLVTLLTRVLVMSAAATPAWAQVSARSDAFQLVRLERQATLYVYMYRLMGPTKPTEIFADVYLDVAVPKRRTRPELLGVQGPFVGNGVAANYDEVSRSHPPLWIGTPSNWPAAIYSNAVVSWGASRYGNGRGWSAGVKAGEELGGFELRSPGIPMLRRWRVVPLRPFGEADQSELPRVKDTTWVMREGIVLGPGDEPAYVTLHTLAEQLRIATIGYLLDEPGRYLRLLDVLTQAAREQNALLWQGALRRFRTTLAADRVSSQVARTVLTGIVDALVATGPSGGR